MVRTSTPSWWSVGHQQGLPGAGITSSLWISQLCFAKSSGGRMEGDTSCIMCYFHPWSFASHLSLNPKEWSVRLAVVTGTGLYYQIPIVLVCSCPYTFLIMTSWWQNVWHEQPINKEHCKYIIFNMLHGPGETACPSVRSNLNSVCVGLQNKCPPKVFPPFRQLLWQVNK